MGTRSAREVWGRIVAEAGEEEIEHAAGVSVAQASKELADAGVDVAAERARAEAELDSLEGGTAPCAEVRAPAAPEERRPRRRVPAFAWVGAAAAAAAVAMGAPLTYWSLRASTGDGDGTTGTAPTSSTSSPSPGATDAADLRRRAAAACDAGRARECITLLDQARILDGPGDRTVAVRILRSRAIQELGREPPR